MNTLMVIGFDHMIEKLEYLYSDSDVPPRWRVQYWSRDITGMSQYYEGDASFSLLRFSNLSLFVKEFTESDAVDVYLDDVLCAALIVCFSKLFRKKVSLSFRGSDLGKWKGHNMLRKLVTRLCCCFSDVVFIKEKHMYRTLVESVGCDASKVVELHNAVPLKLFRKNRFSPTSQTFIYINSIRPERRVKEMILAFIEFKRKYPSRYELKIVGDTSSLPGYSPGSDEYLECCKKLVLSEGMEGVITFEPFCSNPWEKITDCFAFVLLADVVWLNNSLLEALAQNIPVLISDKEGADVITGYDKYGVRCSENASEAFQSLVARFAGKHNIMSTRVQDFAKKTFSSEMQINKKYKGLFGE